MHANSQNPQETVESIDCDARRTWINLNEQFLHDIQCLERCLGGMYESQRSLVSGWIDKLKTNPPTLAEAVARNKIVASLLNSMGPTLFSKKTFSAPSMFERFTHISDVMAAEKCSINIAQELMCSSYDKGAFTRKLPVPRSGAFFVVHLRQNL